MKNNKLTASYIKDIFHYMKAYNCNIMGNDKIELSCYELTGGIGVVYQIIVYNFNNDQQVIMAKDIKSLIEKIKNSGYYMMDIL